MYVCMDCGTPARHNDALDCYQCDACPEERRPNRVVPVSTSHIFKRVHHELSSMGLVARLHIAPVAHSQVNGLTTLVEGMSIS